MLFSLKNYDHRTQSSMQVITTNLPGVLLIKPRVFSDQRGFFLESFQQERYRAAGIDANFVQDNHSRSSRGTLRGLHFQRTMPQGKLVSVGSGRVFDVAADINPGSPTFGQHFAVELNDSNHWQVWIPPGYAHGFCVLSETADFHYKCTSYYAPDDEAGIIWNDPLLAIDWPIKQPLLSAKDQQLPQLSQLLQ